MQHILDPVSVSNLAVYLLQLPCRRPSARKQQSEAPVEFLTLDHALATGQVIVHETGTIERLRVENLSRRDLFLQAGEVLRGGLQDRALATDLIVPRRRYDTESGVTVPAFCMEEERWELQQEPGDVFRSAGQMVPTRRLKLALRTGTQERISRELAALENALPNNVGPAIPGFYSGLSLWTVLDAPHLKARLEQWTRPLIHLPDEHPDATGAVFALHGQLNSAELYATPALFRQMWPKLLWSAAAEAMVEGQRAGSLGGKLPAKGEITAWLAALHGGRVAQHLEVVTKRTFRRIRSADGQMGFETLDEEQGGLCVHESILNNEQSSCYTSRANP